MGAALRSNSAPPISALVSRLTAMRIHSAGLPRFAAGPSVHAISWRGWKQDHAEDESFKDYLSRRLLRPPAQQQRTPSASTSSSNFTPRLVIFGEQHHQPRVIAAQLQMVQHIATAIARPAGIKVKIVMEHFNLKQQHLLDNFAKTGDPVPLQEEYAKTNEGFRIDDTGYLPLLKLAREHECRVIAGFPPREWARSIMREGRKSIADNAEIQSSKLLEGYDRWDDLDVTPEHAAYIKSSISGEKPFIVEPVEQGGLKAAQAFKDSVMAWKIDQQLASPSESAEAADDDHSSDIVVAICGSGHCEHGFGVTERIRSVPRSKAILIVTKPVDGEFWAVPQEPLGSKADLEVTRSSQPGQLADAVIIYEAVDI